MWKALLVIETNQQDYVLVVNADFIGVLIEGQWHGRKHSSFEWRTWLRARRFGHALEDI